MLSRILLPLVLLHVLPFAAFSADSKRGASPQPQTQQYGPVRARETLWDIAELFASADLSVSQTAILIFRHNPHAFYQNNINRLKQGEVLVIPSAPTKQWVASSEAIQVLQQHDSSYRQFYREFTMKPQALRQLKQPLTAVAALPQADTAGAVPVSQPAGSQQRPVEAQLQPAALEESLLMAAADAGQTSSSGGGHEKHHDEIALRFSYDVSASYDDNIRRAQWDSDIRDDYLVNLIIKGKMLMDVSRFSKLSLGGRLGVEKYSTFDQLDNTVYQLEMNYSFAFSSGYTAPVYALKLALGGVDFVSNIRTSDTASIGLEVNAWLSNTISFTGGVKYKQREARSEVFDTEETQLFANLDLQLSRRSILYLTYSYLAGDIVSSATPRLGIINSAEVIEPDDAFGGVAFNQFAYRLDADSHVYTLGYNSAIRRGLTYDLSLRFVDSEAQDNAQIYYERMIVRAGLLGRF